MVANDNSNFADDPSGINWAKVVADGEGAQVTPPVQAPPITEDDPTGIDWHKVVAGGNDPEQNLRTSMYSGMQYQPDRMAKAVPMAAAQGISPDMAYRQMDDKDWTQGAMFDENNYQQLIKDYPKLSNFLSDQNNAAISHDDIGPLQKLEDWGNQWAADNKGKSAYEMMENDPLNPLSRLQALASATGGGFGLVARGLGQALLNTSSLGNLPGASPVDKFLMQGTGLAGKGLLGFANFMEGQAKEFAPQNQDLLNKALGLGGSLVPLAVGGPLAMGSQMMGQTYEHADQMKLPLNSPRVNGAALLSGIIGTFGGMMVGKAAGAVIPEAAGVYAGNMADKARQLVNATPGSAREAMVNRTMDYATSLIHAVAGFAGYTLAQNSVFRGVLQDQSTQYSTGVAEAAKEGGAFGLITAMMGHGAALINNYHDTVSQPEMTRESLRQAGELVQESKLQGRSPQKMNDYLNQQLGDNSLYVRPANFQTFFSKLPPETQGEITKNMPEIPDQLSNALKTGEDMEINQADYHTYIQPHGPALDDWMRLAPEHFSVGDQAEYQKHMDEVQAAQEEETPSGRGSGQVYDRMYDQLQQPVGERIAPTGMPHIADTYATAIQNSYDALVENYGHIPGAKDFIDSFLGNAKILREYPHMMASRIKSTDDDLWLDQMRNLAKKSGNTSKAPTPLIDFLKKKGIQEGSNAAQTLESLGITKQTHRALFRKAPEEAGNDMFPGTKTKSDKHGITDFSDIDVNDLNNELGDHGYQFREGEQHGADPDAVADALRRESFGEGQKRDDIQARDQALEELSNALDQEGIDLTTATNDQIRAALDRLSSAYSKQNGQEFFQSAYHGGPHDFDKFTLDHIGKGEGAQAYGWGLYFADKKGIAEYYRQGLSSPFTLDGEPFGGGRGKGGSYHVWLKSAVGETTFESLKSGKITQDEAVKKLEASLSDRQADLSEIEGKTRQEGKKDTLRGKIDLIKQDIDIFKRLKPSKGQLYEAQIPDDHNLLNWDKTYDEQSPEVKKVLEAAGIKAPEKPPAPKDAVLATVVKKALALNEGNPRNIGLVVDNDQQLYNAILSKMEKEGIDPEKVSPGAYVEKNAAQYLKALQDNADFTGQKIYNQIAKKHAVEDEAPGWNTASRDTEDTPWSGHKGASLELNGRGVKGIKFLDGGSRADGEGTSNYVIFDDSAIKILKKFYQGDGDGARGSVSFGPNQETVIRLFSRERLDTLLHEMGHVYFTALRHIAELPGAEGAAEDVKALKDWAKQDTDYIHRYVTKFSPYEVREMPNGSYKVFANGQEPDEEQVADDTKTGAERFAAAQNERIQKQYQDLGGEEFLKNISYGSYTEGDLERHIQTGYEEKMADAMLSYVRDGEAPSAEIKPAFDKFKAWVTRLYAGERDTLPKINPEVKQVFDRMFATESQIQKMKAQPEFNIDPAISSFLNKVDQTRYQRSWSRMVSEAQDRLFRQAMKQSEVAGGKEYKEARASFKEEAQAQADSEQRFKAADQIRSAGGLSRDGLTKLFGKEVLKKEYLGVHGLLAKRGEKGIDPQMMATITGYRSAKEMVDTFMNMPKKADYVNQLTDNLMVERKGDMLKDGTIEREAVEAYHNNMRAEVLGFEMKKLAALAKIDAPSPEMMKVRATTMLGDRVLKDVRPYSFYRAEVNAARDVGKNLAKKNFEAAAVAKAKQLLNHHLYKMSTDAKASMNRTLEKWGDVLRRSDDKLAKKYDIDYIYAARKIASDHGFPVKSNFFDFATWQKNLEANDPETAKILNDTLSVAQMGDKTPFNAMTWNDFQTLRDDIGCLIEQANGQRTQTLEGQKIEREFVRNKIVDSLADHSPVMKFDDLHHQSESKSDARKKLGVGLTMHFMRMESWVTLMDGGRFDGPIRKYAYQPVRKANDVYLSKTTEATNLARETLGHVDLLGDKIYAPELKVYDKSGEPINNGQGYTFANKGEVIGAILHHGNGFEPGSNGYKLLRGNGWHQNDWQSFLDRGMADGTITKGDMDTVQGMWKMMASMKDDIWKAHKQMYGFYPKEVTSVPFKTPFGEYEGGYWPVKYDPVKDDHVAAQYEKNSLTSSAVHAWPTTGKASTMSRDNTFARPIQMKLEFLPAHIDWAMRFAHLEPAVREAAKIMFDPAIKEAIDRVNPRVRENVILPWLQRTARQDMDLSSGGTIKEFGGAANFIKDAFYMKTLGLNLKYPLQRLGEIAPIIHDTSYDSFQKAFGDLVRDNANTRQSIAADSQFMNQRGSMFEENAANELRNLITDRNPYQKVSDFAKQHAFYTVRETHRWLDELQWMSAKYHALDGKAKGVDPDNYQQVVDYADSRVRTTQATFGPADVSNIEGGTPTGRMLWTVFQSVMNTKLNAAYTEYKMIKDSTAPVQARGIAMASMFINRLMIPMFISDQILHYINQGGPVDRHHEHSVKAWAEALAFDGIKSLTSLVPVASTMAETGLAKLPFFQDMGEKPYNDTMEVTPAAMSLFDDVIRIMPHDLYNAMFNHGSKAKALTSVLTALGDVAKVPVTQVEKTLGYLAAVHSGKQQPHGAMDVARGLIGGPNIKN